LKNHHRIRALFSAGFEGESGVMSGWQCMPASRNVLVCLIKIFETRRNQSVFLIPSITAQASGSRPYFVELNYLESSPNFQQLFPTIASEGNPNEALWFKIKAGKGNLYCTSKKYFFM
jgi:hypothetical protein